MLVVYILTKSKFLKVKIVRDKEGGVFKYGNFEYHIDRQRIYQKKFLFFKLFFWSMYLEGVPNPLEFSEFGYSIGSSDVPLDELAILLRKIRHGFLDLLIALLVLFNMVITCYAVYMLYELQKVVVK